MPTYCDRAETDYRKDNVTITMRYAESNSTEESLFEGHRELKAKIRNDIIGEDLCALVVS